VCYELEDIMRRRRFPHFFILMAASSVFVGAAPGQTVSPASADPGTIATSSTRQSPTAKAAQKPPSAASPSPDNWTQQDQPVSLGELARRVRTQKNSQAKAVRIFDDENMPRAPISAGEKAPDFSGQGAGSSSSGKVIVLDFWATWCGPCRHALPGLKQLQAMYGGSQVEVVSISEDEDPAEWSSFVAQNQMNWTQRLDSNHQIMRQYGASALPTYVLIGKDGKVLQQYVGDDPNDPIVERMGPDLKRSLEGKS
jgi:cytochrome c biogenesis protein CcmG/thiol:disulfide interchange protein DsbE